MSYPDLLFLQPPAGKLIPACVYEDMKLDSMLTPVAVEVMRRVCGREDILARQSMFRALSRTAFRTHMQRLSEDMTLLRALSGRYEESRCEEERWALYVNLSDALCAFFERAAQEISDALKEQFGMDIEKNKIVQAEPIKSYGSYTVKAKLGYEISGSINVLVVEG